MGSAKMTVGRVFLVRADYDSEIVEFVTNLANREQLFSASFTAIGALKNAKLGFYNQQTHQYAEHVLVEPHEIASCIGNVSLKNGKPFVHAHAVLSNSSGNTRGGHLIEGRVFAAEIHLIELLGQNIEREVDKTTGLSLWNI